MTHAKKIIVALPYLIKHIYNGGSEEVIRRGKKIHTLGNVELIEHDELMGNVTLRVKDDTYATFYKVYINNFKDEKNIGCHRKTICKKCSGWHKKNS